MDGLGNDFVIIDMRKNKYALSKKDICKISNRKTGIGFDQLIVLEKSKICDVKMKIFNADGSTAGACGNGTRCVASFIFAENKKLVLTLEAPQNKILKAWRGKLIKVDMGLPQKEWQKIPLAKNVDTDKVSLLKDLPKAVCTSMGNPHAVFFVKDLSKIDIAKYGPLIENHKMFPERTNVEFVQVLSANKIKMRVWERGAGITNACGSGACAVLAGAYRNNLSANKAQIIMDGGTLIIEQNKEGHILMQGATHTAFKGTLFL